jgi:short-subunit dehydrogenase
MTKTILITGASAGIGAALARHLGRQGHHLVLAARRGPELERVAAECGAGTEVVVADVRRRADVERLRDAALRRSGYVDVWVNNAGRGITRAVLDFSDEDLDEMMAVNASRSAYSAAKHALNALTANLRMELRSSHPGVHVSLVMPGVVRTAFAANALGSGPGGGAAGGGPPGQTAEEVAAVIAELIACPRAEVYANPASAEMVRRYFQDVAVFEAQSSAGSHRAGGPS